MSLSSILRSRFGALLSRRFLLQRDQRRNLAPFPRASAPLLTRIASAEPAVLMARAPEIDAILAGIPPAAALEIMAALEDRAPGIMDTMRSMAGCAQHFRHSADIVAIFDSGRLQRLKHALVQAQKKGGI